MGSNLPKNFPGGAPSGDATGGSSLPKNFPSSAPEPTTATAARPEVERAEIAGFFAERIVALRDQSKGSSTRPRFFAVEFPYRDFEFEVATAYASRTGGSLHPGGNTPTAAEPAGPLVMLGSSINGMADIERFVHYLNHGNDVSVFCPRTWMMPQAVLDLVDKTLVAPRFDAELFVEACKDFYELSAAPDIGTDTDWVGNVVPKDFLLNSQAVGDEIVPALRDSVERRLARYMPEDAPTIADLAGMDEAREWALSMVEEITLAKAGKLAWANIENKVVLTGRRGVGKTSLSWAIARAAGLRFVETSAARWLSTEEEPMLGHIRLHADFDEALAAAPAVFCIDDVDCLSEAPWVGMVMPFLQLLQNLKPEDQLVVVGGAESPQAIPFVLRSRGGFESTLSMPAPSSQALARMYQRMMKSVSHSLQPADFEEIGRLSLGLAGHELDLIVRRAQRRARRAGSRPVTKEDIARVLIQERYGAQAESRRRMMAEDELRSVAYHEAGHAILQLMRRNAAGLRYASIIPRENGTLGFVLPGIDETRTSMTQQHFTDEIRVCLAGRAAEEVLGGRDAVTSGCASDLYSATGRIQFMLTRTGLNGLLSLDLKLETSPELRKQAEELLNAEYEYVVAELKRHRHLLDQVAGLLIERQEVSGDELMTLYSEYRAKSPD
jgi:ATP-dependent Zn protease